MEDMSFVLRLHKERLPGIKSVRRIPDIEEFIYKDVGKLYCVKYFLDAGRGYKMIRITSKEKSFKTIFTLDICGLDLQPGPSFELKPMSKEKFLNFVGKIVSTAKYKLPQKRRIRESIYFSEKVLNNWIQEDGPGIFSKIAKKTRSFYDVILLNISKLSGVIVAIGIVMIVISYITKIRNWLIEKQVEGTIEKDINDKLFSDQIDSDPAFVLFAKLRSYIKYITIGKSNAMIVYGPPGMSKTYTVRRTFYFEGLRPGKDYVIEKGSTLNLASVYSLLFENRDRILVLDDFDTPLKNAETVNLLKACTDTYSRRIISLPKEKMLQSDEIEGSAAPSKFEFRGKIIIITNLDRSDIDIALLSRAPAVRVDYNSDEVLKSLKLTLKYVSPQIPEAKKLEVYNYMIKLYNKNPKQVRVDFRSFQTSVDARVGCPEEWQSMTRLVLGIQ